MNSSTKHPPLSIIDLCRAVLTATAILAALSASTQLPKLVAAVRYLFVPDVSVLLEKYPQAQGKSGRQNFYNLVDERPNTWRTLPQISRAAVLAVLTSEDGGFFAHNGFEPAAIKAAWQENVKAGRYIKGGSTITQQVAKNIFLSPDKTLVRKARELLIATELERVLGKRKILEIYLNIAEWGPNIYGIEQAARSYFAKSAHQLTAREGAMLAFMLPNPNKLRHSVLGSNGFTHFGQRRVFKILERLWRNGKISEDEYASSMLNEQVPSDL